MRKILSFLKRIFCSANIFSRFKSEKRIIEEAKDATDGYFSMGSHKGDSTWRLKRILKAVEIGYEDPKALWVLGKCYAELKDREEAVKWYRKAAEQGHEGAKNALKELGY